jgi:signal transduction histidine kinase/CheY-like chemotaxis protein
VINHVRISRKITALVMALGAICLWVALFAGSQLTLTSAQYAELTNRREPALVALAGAERANYEMAYGAAMTLVYPGASEQGRVWARSVTQSYDEGQAYLAEAREASPDLRTKIAALERQLRDNKIKLDEAVEPALFSRLGDATTALTAADPGVVAFGEATHRLIDQGIRQHRMVATSLETAARRTRSILLLVSITGVAWAIAGGLWMARATITNPLARLRVSMQALAEGDSEVAITGQDRGDEIGAMARAVQVFKDNALRLLASENRNLSMADAKQRAEAANEAKRLFLAHMTHELRTPLNGVLGMAYVMAQDDLNDLQRQRLETIHRSGQDLLHVINNVLDFSKIEAGKLELENIAFDVDDVIEDTYNSFAHIAEGKGIALNLDALGDGGGLRHGDPIRLRQIVSNFVANAIKFTQKGDVTISVKGLGDNGRDGIVVSVRDTGLGVAEHLMPMLFQSFSQLDASTTRQFDGTGLGLAISRELADLMDGRVWAESVLGVGSVFHAELGLPRIDHASTAQSRGGETSLGSQAAGALRVLAAEDNPTNQSVLAAIMESFGIALHLVDNGRAAVEAWSQGGFNLILMDIQMPEMDGLEATRAIRAAEVALGLPRTPIFALTANAFVHQIDAYVAAGMDGHLAKPIEIPRLAAVLDGALVPPL